MGEALKGLLVPTVMWNADYFTMLVAIAGTTISPYLFFWQAAEEAEEVRIEPSGNRCTRLASAHGVRRIRADTGRDGLLQACRRRHHHNDGGDPACAWVTDIQSSAEAAEPCDPSRAVRLPSSRPASSVPGFCSSSPGRVGRLRC